MLLGFWTHTTPHIEIEYNKMRIRTYVPFWNAIHTPRIEEREKEKHSHTLSQEEEQKNQRKDCMGYGFFISYSYCCLFFSSTLHIQAHSSFLSFFALPLSPSFPLMCLMKSSSFVRFFECVYCAYHKDICRERERLGHDRWVFDRARHAFASFFISINACCMCMCVTQIQSHLTRERESAMLTDIPIDQHSTTQCV